MKKKQKTEAEIIRELTLSTLLYLKSKDENLLKLIEENTRILAQIYNISLSRSDKYNGALFDSLMEILDTEKGYLQTLNKFYNVTIRNYKTMPNKRRR